MGARRRGSAGPLTPVNRKYSRSLAGPLNSRSGQYRGWTGRIPKLTVRPKPFASGGDLGLQDGRARRSSHVIEVGNRFIPSPSAQGKPSWPRARTRPAYYRHQRPHRRVGRDARRRRIRAERAETDLDTDRTEIQRLAEQFTQAPSADRDSALAKPSPRRRTPSRTKKTAAR